MIPRKTRPPEQIQAERAAILALADGTRKSSEIAKLTGRSTWEINSDIQALRKQGFSVPMNITPSSFDAGGTLYRHFNADGQLLYVGACSDPMRRIALHKSRSSWYRQVVRIELEHFDDGTALVYAEREAIRREKPIHNVAFSSSEDAA